MIEVLSLLFSNELAIGLKLAREGYAKPYSANQLHVHNEANLPVSTEVDSEAGCQQMEVLRYGIHKPPLVHALISHVGKSESNALKLVFNSGAVVALGFLRIFKLKQRLFHILVQYIGPLFCKNSCHLGNFTILLIRHTHGEIELLLKVVLENRSGDVEDDRRQE